MLIQATSFPLSYIVMKHVNQSLDYYLFLHLVIFVSDFPKFSFVRSKYFCVYVQKLKENTFLDLVTYDYFQTIQLLKDFHVPIYQ